ncbi:hypothetical protein BsWGS_23633 [Bradybaena similaris]
MSEPCNINLKNGGFTSFRDIAIQEQLLEADDGIIAKELLSSEIRAGRWKKNGFHNCNNNGTNPGVNDNNGGKNNGNVKKCRHFPPIPFCGWHVDPNVSYRKAENGAMPKAKLSSGSATKDTSVARDSKSKTYSSDDFLFQHYLDTNHYIEQYRQQHTCTNTITLSAAKSDLSDLRKPHPNQQYSPMTIFSQTIFQHEASLVSSQLVTLSAQTSDKQNQTQATTTQLTSKREQQRPKIHSKLKNPKKTYSPPISTCDISKVMGVSDSAPASRQSERASSAKELVSIPAADTPFLKTAANMMKVQTLNIDTLPAKYTKLPKSGPIMDPVTGGQRVGPGVSNQTKMLDATAFRIRSGTEKQSPGSQKITDCSDAHLEPALVANGHGLNSKPAHLLMTSMCKEEHGQKQQPDINEKLQVLHPLVIKSSRSDMFRNDIDNCLHQTLDKRHSLKLDKMLKQIVPRRDNSLLAVTGLDCSKTRKFVSDRLVDARKENDKFLLSHKRRIQLLIEQSKLKYRTLNTSKVPDKTILEIKNIQITDPFVKAVPGNSQMLNNRKAGQNVSSDHFSCEVDCKNYNNVKNCNRKAETIHSKIPVNCAETFARDGDKEFDNISSCNESTQNNSDLGLSHLYPAMCTSGLEYSSPQTDVSYTDKDVKTQRGRDLCAACDPASDAHVPKSKLKEACFNQSYFQRFAKEVSTMNLTLPKLRYSEIPLVCKSHSLGL